MPIEWPEKAGHVNPTFLLRYKESFDGADKLTLKHPQHLPQIVTSFQDLAIHADDGVLPLFEPQFGALFDSIKRMLGAASEHAEHSDVAQVRHAIVAPFTCCNHPAVEPKNHVQFGAVKRNLLHRLYSRGVM